MPKTGLRLSLHLKPCNTLCCSHNGWGPGTSQGMPRMGGKKCRNVFVLGESNRFEHFLLVALLDWRIHSGLKNFPTDRLYLLQDLIYCMGTKFMPNPFTHAKSVTFAIITVVLGKPLSSTKMESFLMDHNFQVLCTYIVLWRWNLDLSSYQEMVFLAITKHISLTLRLASFSICQTWTTDDMAMVVGWWTKETRKLIIKHGNKKSI